MSDRAKAYKSKLLSEIISGITPEKQAKTDKRMILAVLIDKARMAKGWTRSEFALKMGQQPSVITKWLSGTHNFTIDTLFDLEEKLDTILLYMGKEEKTSPIPLYRVNEPDVDQGQYKNGNMAGHND